MNCSFFFLQTISTTSSKPGLECFTTLDYFKSVVISAVGMSDMPVILLLILREAETNFPSAPALLKIGSMGEAASVILKQGFIIITVSSS